MRRAGCLVLVLAACASEAPPPAPPDPTATLLSPVDRLIRASTVLRGIRPSLKDLRAVDVDPTKLEAIVDGYLHTPEFATTVREMHDEALMVRVQLSNYAVPAVHTLSTVTFEQSAASVYEEPLRLIEDVVTSDSPYTKIVTADYTMADPVVATVWGLPHSPGLGWERAQYPDGRGAVGILGSSSFYFRHRSNGINFNRGRAATFAKALLCHDYAASEIKIDTSIDLSDPVAVATAVSANPSCAGCHQTLDPLASYLFQFYQGLIVPQAIPGYPVDFLYTAADTDKWGTTNGRPPNFFGQAAEGLQGLGQAIAADPRFARCAVTRFASYMTETPPDQLDRGWIARLQKDFAESGYNARKIIRAIAMSDEFATVASTDPTRAANLVGFGKLRPQQYGRMLRDLTGFYWHSFVGGQFGYWRAVGNVDYMDDDLLGFRVLMGGIDSFYVTDPVHTMNATSSLVVRELASRAAQFVVDHDTAVGPTLRTLFVVPPSAYGDDSVRTQLAHLHARIFGELHDPDLESSLALFHDALAASGDARRAWVVTLTAMFSDVRVVYY